MPSHEFDQDLRNLQVEVKLISSHLDMYIFIDSHSFP